MPNDGFDPCELVLGSLNAECIALREARKSGRLDLMLTAMMGSPESLDEMEFVGKRLRLTPEGFGLRKR
jgi:hypothetical protein